MGIPQRDSLLNFLTIFHELLPSNNSMAMKIRCASKAIFKISNCTKPFHFAPISRCTSASSSVLTCGRLRYSSAAAIPEAPVLGDPKVYAPKIQNLVSEISGLTLIEVADLNEL